MPSKTTNSPSRKVVLGRTQGEWDAIDKTLKNKGSDFHSHVRRESSRLRNQYKKCGVCVTPAQGDKLIRKHLIPPDIYADLEELARIKGVAVSQVINEFIIMPLLLQEKDAAL